MLSSKVQNSTVQPCTRGDNFAHQGCFKCPFIFQKIKNYTKIWCFANKFFSVNIFGGRMLNKQTFKDYLYARKRDRDHQRQRKTERQKDVETQRQRDRETERQRDRETQRQIERHRDREIDRQIDRQTEEQRYRDTGKANCLSKSFSSNFCQLIKKLATTGLEEQSNGDLHTSFISNIL